MTHSFSTKVLWFLALFLFCCTGFAWAGDEIAFSGVVKKVLPAKNKVAIKDPETKKRFTVIVDDKTKITGWQRIEDIKKGDAISGKYVVTEKGLYVASELNGK